MLANWDSALYQILVYSLVKLKELWLLMMKKLSILAVCLVMVGCSSMSKEQCISADWRSYGYQDGATGKETTNFQRYSRTCGDYGIETDFQAYLEGHKQGLTVFCTEPKGEEYGAKGYRYSGICKSYDESAFLKGYQSGQKVYHLNAQIRQESNELRRLERLYTQKQQQISDNEEEIIADQTTPDRRRLLLQQNEELKQELEQIDRSLHASQRRLEALQRKLQKLKH